MDYAAFYHLSTSAFQSAQPYCSSDVKSPFSLLKEFQGVSTGDKLEYRSDNTAGRRPQADLESIYLRNCMKVG